MGTWILRVLLAVSIVVNVWLLSARRSPTASASAAPPGSSVEESVAPTPGRASESVRLDARKLLAQLHDAGVPLRHRYAIAVQLARAEIDPRRPNGTGTTFYRWQQGLRATQPSPDDRARTAAFDVAELQRVEEWLGPEYQAAKPAMLAITDPKFAALPPEKLSRLAAIDGAHVGSTHEALSELKRQRAMDRAGQVLAELEAQRAKAIAALLTPAELEIYERYHSPRAATLKRGLVGSEIDDAQYVAIHDAVQGFEPQSFGGVARAVEAIAARADAAAALRYIERFDTVFGASIGTFHDAGIPDAEIVRLYGDYFGLYVKRSGHEAAQAFFDELVARLPESERKVFPHSRLGRELRNRMTPPPRRS